MKRCDVTRSWGVPASSERPREASCQQARKRAPRPAGRAGGAHAGPGAAAAPCPAPAASSTREQNPRTSYAHTRHPRCLPLRAGRGDEDGWEDPQTLSLKLSSPKISPNLIRLHHSLRCDSSISGGFYFQEENVGRMQERVLALSHLCQPCCWLPPAGRRAGCKGTAHLRFSTQGWITVTRSKHRIKKINKKRNRSHMKPGLVASNVRELPGARREAVS